MSVGDLASFAQHQFIKRTEWYRDAAKARLAEVRDLRGAVPPPPSYEPYAKIAHMPAGDLTATVHQLLTVEEVLLSAIVTSTEDLIRALNGVFWDKIPNLFAVTRDEPEQTFWSRIVTFVTMKFIQVEEALDRDADAFRRWSKLESIQPMLAAEAEAIQLKRAHIYNIAQMTDWDYMEDLVQAIVISITAHKRHAESAAEWIESGRRLLDREIEKLYGRVERWRLLAPSGPPGILILPQPVQHPALQSPEDRIDACASHTEQKNLAVHIDDAEAALEVENREPDPVRTGEHLDGHRQDQGDGEAGAEACHDIRQRGRKDH
jgi:hypothetical protein